VDLIIPRGGKGLIDFVRANATVPVIETGAGVCHTYFDADGNSKMGAAIVCNAKTRRVSVCNALDCLLVHADRLGALPILCRGLIDSHVIIYADEPAYNILAANGYPQELLQHADVHTYGTEYLDYKMSVRVVASLEEAVRHIARYGSGHSECIITDSAEAADYFRRAVDAACVYVNVPTSFTDGGEFGLGAEIGISTQKLHARGPMGLRELTTYKWLIEGAGQVREA
jgi:glutamate-5-semialdehyde dehydrogenase